LSKTILTQLEGFTPVMDGMSAEVGVMATVVFGRIWRFCQMKDNTCWASQSTISELLGIDEDTVSKSEKKLVENGYLEEIKRPGQTSVFKDTGKAGITISISANLPKKAGATYRKKRELPTEKIGTKKVLKESNKESIKEKKHAPISEEIDISPIQAILEEIIGLPPANTNDITAMDEIEKMGASREDVKNGVDEYIKTTGKTVRYYSSIVGWVRTAMSKRIQVKPSKKYITKQDLEAYRQ